MAERLSSSDVTIRDETLFWQEESRLLADVLGATPRVTRGVAGLATAGYMAAIAIAAVVFIVVEETTGSGGSALLYGGTFAALVALSWGIKRWAGSPKRPAELILAVTNKRSALLAFKTMRDATDAAKRIMAAVAKLKSTAGSADAAATAG